MEIRTLKGEPPHVYRSSIKQPFTIKDKNIEINSFKEDFYRNKKATIIEATLIRSFSNMGLRIFLINNLLSYK